MHLPPQRIGFWAHHLGLLPVSVLPNEFGRFVMLNGSRGNFCLDFGEHAVANADAKGVAWSANVGHYVIAANEQVQVHRWDRPAASAEIYPAPLIADNIEKFHEYLDKTEPSVEFSVITHVLRVFRKLRATMPQADGRNALLAFLHLLATAVEQRGVGNIRHELWGLTDESSQLALEIASNEWQLLLEELLEPKLPSDLPFSPNLTLRHAAGQIFQEAHYEATLTAPNQLGLGFDIIPAKIGNRADAIGIHFTPPSLARTLVEQALLMMQQTRDALNVFDPACGSGEFLRECIRQLRMRGYTGTIKVYGFDLSPIACDMARFVLTWEKRQDSLPIEVDIQCRDSLKQDSAWPKDIDLLLMNPPFVSYENLLEAQRQTIRDVMGGLAIRRMDLSMAFLWKAANHLSKGSILGSIIPASLLESESASELRSALAELFYPRLLGRLGSHILFRNAIVDAALIAGKIGETNPEVVAFWADHRPRSNADALRELRKWSYRSSNSRAPVGTRAKGYSIYSGPKDSVFPKTWAPRPYDAVEFLSKLSHLPTVKDLFQVHQGARTGLQTAFIITKSYLHQLPFSERKFFRPAILNESINAGSLNDSKYVFYPHGDREIQSERALARLLPTYFSEVLCPHKSLLQKRAKTDPEKWWELTWSRNWQHAETRKLVSVFFGDKGSFAWDKAGSYVVVQGYAWLPKARLRPFRTGLALAYLAVLNSDVISELLAATSNSVRGGQWDLATRFVENIPIPDLSAEVAPNLVDALAFYGRKLQSGEDLSIEDLSSLVHSIYLRV